MGPVGAVPGGSAATVSRGISVMAHRIPTHKTPRKRPCIPPLAWGHGVLGHAASHELRRHHELLAHEILQVLLRDLRRGPVLFHHESRGKEKQHYLKPQKSLSPLFFRCREEDEKATTDCARGHKGA
jgi:hypothetical protein